MQGKVEPFPQIKPYEPFNYEAFNLPDPFKPRKLSTGGGGGMQPDLTRPKEPLEAYSLETLKMVGVVTTKVCSMSYLHRIRDLPCSRR